MNLNCRMKTTCEVSLQPPAQKIVPSASNNNVKQKALIIRSKIDMCRNSAFI